MQVDINITTKGNQYDEEKEPLRKFAFFNNNKRRTQHSIVYPEVRHKTNFGYTFKEIPAFQKQASKQKKKYYSHTNTPRAPDKLDKDSLNKIFPVESLSSYI